MGFDYCLTEHQTNNRWRMAETRPAMSVLLEWCTNRGKLQYSRIRLC